MYPIILLLYMVNKQTLRVPLRAPVLSMMRYSFILLLLALCVTTTQAQKISKYYTSRLQEANKLFFIFPHDGFQNRELHSHLEYDLTYLTEKDSITMNFSYFDEEEREIDSISFNLSGMELVSPAKRIFVETHKKKWHYRYSAELLYDDLERLFKQGETPELLLHCRKSTVQLLIKKGTWKKQAMINGKIFRLMQYNK